MLDRASMAERSVKGSYVRNVAYYDDSMSLRLQEEQRLLSDMEQGIQNGEFQVYYQPKCRLDTGKVVGAEALVRWNHPQRGLLMPGTFVPIFEKNGFIMKLDEYIWEQVCIFLKKCREADPDCLPHISVNLSRVDLYNPQLCDTLESLCQKYGVPNEQMEVEITESAYVDNAHLLLDLAEKFHERGFNVQMDDFGSGYSSLNMLNEIPVDVLKLDMRFLYRFSREGRSTSILSSIVNMTRNLRISVIAEGVETEEQARFLAGIGCKQAQGYYYHKPLTEEDFLALLRQEMREVSTVHDQESAELYLGQLLTPAMLVSRRVGVLEMISCNEYYFGMIQVTDANFSRSDRVLNHWIGAGDEKTLAATMDEARSSGAPVSCCYLQRDLIGGYHLLDCVVEYVCDQEDGSLYVMILTERY
jgi:EAL domain-containing protein (putative c-di-GMP-specific phosphodiesterase class I)